MNWTKIIIIAIILLLLMFFINKFILFKKHTPKKHTPKKEWLFLVNGKNATITNNEVNLKLDKSVIAFTDRPYHESHAIPLNKMNEFVSMVSNTKDKANATLIGLHKDNSDHVLIEIQNISFDESNNTISIKFDLLNGNINYNKYEFISITIDDFGGWFTHTFVKPVSHVVSNVSHDVSHAVNTIVSECQKGPVECGKGFCESAVSPLLKFAKEEAISETCTEVCAEGGGEIILEGGGPEDPVADAAGATFSALCAAVCTKSLKLGLEAYDDLPANNRPTKGSDEYGDLLGEYLCSAIFH